MRILTHNMLMCNVKGCTTNNFPLEIEATKVETVPSPFNAQFVINVIPKLDWPALVKGASYIGVKIPDVMPEKPAEDEEFLKQLWQVLQDIHVLEGNLICPNCKRSFPISQGIPNMGDSFEGPTWASTNLGVFVCMRCSGIHRSLGTHISKVKSTVLDNWKPEMVARMARVGNGVAKLIFEFKVPSNYPRNFTDQHQLVSWIRSKYEHKKWYNPDNDPDLNENQNGDDPSSDEDQNNQANFSQQPNRQHQTSQPPMIDVFSFVSTHNANNNFGSNTTLQNQSNEFSAFSSSGTQQDGNSFFNNNNQQNDNHFFASFPTSNTGSGGTGSLPVTPTIANSNNNNDNNSFFNNNGNLSASSPAAPVPKQADTASILRAFTASNATANPSTMNLHPMSGHSNSFPSAPHSAPPMSTGGWPNSSNSPASNFAPNTNATNHFLIPSSGTTSAFNNNHNAFSSFGATGQPHPTSPFSSPYAYHNTSSSSPAAPTNIHSNNYGNFTNNNNMGSFNSNGFGSTDTATSSFGISPANSSYTANSNLNHSFSPYQHQTPDPFANLVSTPGY